MQTAAASAPPRFRAAPGAALTVRSSAIGPRGPIMISFTGRGEPFTLEYLELATHHGHTTGVLEAVVLPAESRRYVGANGFWLGGVWAALAILLILEPRTFESRAAKMIPAYSDCGRRGKSHDRPALTHSLAVPRRPLARYICRDGPAGYALEDVARRRQKLGSSGRSRADRAGTYA